jgi:hypothetical protein
VSDLDAEPQLDGILEIRKPGTQLEDDVIGDDFVLMLGVEFTNFPKFSRVDDSVTYAKGALDIRHQLDVDSGRSFPTTPGRTGLTCVSPTSQRSTGDKGAPLEREVSAALR